MEASKVASEVAAKMMAKWEADRPGLEARAKYEAADRCRICRGGGSDLPNALEVRVVVDQELMRNSTYKGAAVAVQHLVMDWPEDEQPNYAAVRNHARRHLKRDDAFARQILERHAIDAGVDVEGDIGSILTPAGLMALVQEMTYEGLRDGSLKPTILEGLKASEALEAASSQRLKAELDETRARLRALASIAQETAPDALRALGPERLSIQASQTAVPLPAPDQPSEGSATSEGERPFTCDVCGIRAKSKGGLSQHHNRKHRSA